MRRMLLALLIVAGCSSAASQESEPTTTETVVAAEPAVPAVLLNIETIEDVRAERMKHAAFLEERAVWFQALQEAAAQEEAERQAAAKAVAAKPPARPVAVVAPSGDCGGWKSLVAAYFPGEVSKACSVLVCESGGNPTVHNRTSSASGLWQFLDSTWESVTGTPAPAANYSPETQTAAAAKLRSSSGWGQWSCR